MNYEALKKLKSGSDVRGVAVGENKTLTSEAVSLIVKAFICWLSKKYNKTNLKVALGGDCRISTDEILSTSIEAALSCGADTYLCGRCPPPLCLWF